MQAGKNRLLVFFVSFPISDEGVDCRQRARWSTQTRTRMLTGGSKVYMTGLLGWGFFGDDSYVRTQTFGHE